MGPSIPVASWPFCRECPFSNEELVQFQIVYPESFVHGLRNLTYPGIWQ